MEVRRAQQKATEYVQNLFVVSIKDRKTKTKKNKQKLKWKIT